MIEQANDGDGCKLFVTTYTLLDFPSLDQANRLSFTTTMSGVMGWRKWWNSWICSASYEVQPQHNNRP